MLENMNIMEESRLVNVCIVICIICVIILILMIKTNIISKLQYTFSMIGRKGKFRNFQDSLLIWIGLSVASFVLSPITTYALCIVLFIFNAVMYMFSMAIDDMEGKTFVDHWTPVFPKMSFTIVGFITWIFITIILFYEYYVDNKRIHYCPLKIFSIFK